MFKVVPIDECIVVERLGSFYKVYETGYCFLTPFIDKIVKKISLKEQELQFEYQNESIIIIYKVINPKLFTYMIKEPLRTLQDITIKTLNEGHEDILTYKLNEIVCGFGLMIDSVDIKNIA